MQIISHSLAFVACLMGLASLPSRAQAALACHAAMTSLDFGTISVRDGVLGQTSGPVTITCAGGTAGAAVAACLHIGAGSGGSGAGQTPRFMTGDAATQLAYQLSHQNTLSAGGLVWDNVAFSIPLDATGNGRLDTTLYAEVTAIGAQVIVGDYASQFDDGLDLSLSFGDSLCDQSGTLSGLRIAAQLEASCTINVSNMDFGMIDATITAPVDQIATITLSCTNQAGYAVGLDQGTHASAGADLSRRYMANGAQLLMYDLYQDSARSIAWGLADGAVAAGFGTGSDQAITVFGRILPHQNALSGTYTDSIVVVVSY
jgi:spore coat protein U-like protein